MVTTAKGRPRRLGDVLVEHGLIAQDQRRAALAAQKRSGKRLGQILVQEGLITHDALNWALGNLLGVPYVQLDAGMVDRDLVRRVPLDLLRRCQAVPMIRVGDEVTLAMADPTDSQAAQDIAGALGARAKVAVADASAIHATLDALGVGEAAAPRRHVPLGSGGHRAPSRQKLLADASGNALVLHHLRRACEQDAEEMLLQPRGDTFRVRYRVGGRLADDAAYPASLLPAVITRLKLMAGLDLTATDAIQESEMALDVDGRTLDVTVSVLSSTEGPAAQLRFRCGRVEPRPLASLFGRAAIGALRRAAAARSGLVVVCGPRRSGCSTTLHALLRATAPGRHAVALERVAAFRAPVATQIEAGPRGDYFALLGRVAEGAPDVVLAENLHDRAFWLAFPPTMLASTLLLGEMRAADALTALALLRENGVGGAVLASSLLLIVAQRLAPEPACEILELDQELRDLLMDNAPASWLRVTYQHAAGGAPTSP